QEMISELPNENVYAINWSSDSLDWKQIPEAEITKNVFKNMHAGTIVLMHDGGHWTMDLSNTAKSLDTIIPRLKQEGYHFVTVPELLHIPYPKN
ncbi:polysaccharide deacetylase family protein, partial [Priestia megaterium]